MANIFRSKEVYKKVNKNESSYDRDVLIPVGEPAKPNSEYGVYVAGEYRPPYYTDGLTILGFSSEHVHVVDYITDYKNTAKEPTTIAFGFSSPPLSFSFKRNVTDELINQPEPGIQLESITSDPAVITNVV